MTPTSNPAVCPDREILGDFLLGKRSATELDEIARHLNACPECFATARSLEARTDVLIDTLREALADDNETVEPACLEGSKAVAGMGFSINPPKSDKANVSKPIGNLGSYELLEEIGRGGTGVVYRARHTRLKTIVAVKVLPPEALTRPDTLARFDREMSTIGQMEHPHIVHATDAGEDEGQHYLVMEHVAGGDFATLVGCHGPLSVAEATTCILQAARGLAYAHAKGMIHRDVKPSNLLLGSDGIVKVSDLGLARVVMVAEGDGSTHTGSLMGTFDYMAPEQALNAKEADERADVYGLGCTLYFLLTGSPPFASESVFETLIAHRELPPPVLRKVRAEVPRPLDRLMQRMLSKSPQDRPQTMEQIVQQIESFHTNGDDSGHGDLNGLLADERREVELKPQKKTRNSLPRRRLVSSWLAASAGAIIGALLVGAIALAWFGSGQPFLSMNNSAARFEVRLVQAADGVQIGYLSDAIDLLDGKLPQQSVVSGRFRFLDFIDPMSNSGGFFDSDLAFPGYTVSDNTLNANYFALSAVATVSIPRPGVWTFGVISDDGFQLSIDGKAVGKHFSTRTQAVSLMPVEFKESGPHEIELIYFEGTGGADLELCVAEGRFEDFDSQAFNLVGASYEGGLPLVRSE